MQEVWKYMRDGAVNHLMKDTTTYCNTNGEWFTIWRDDAEGLNKRRPCKRCLAKLAKMKREANK